MKTNRTPPTNPVIYSRFGQSGKIRTQPVAVLTPVLSVDRIVEVTYDITLTNNKKLKPDP